MWLLKDSSGGIKYLKPTKVTKVGRKDADIILENDSSISRAHASITVTLKEKVEVSEETSVCLIKDSNAKYGSFIVRNGAKLKVTKEGLELHQGDTLTFGLQNCTYTVEYIHFVTVISRLNADHKKELKNIMDEIGGLIIDFYNIHCTHATASVAATTSKIISSLISGIPIVGMNYWIQLRKCVEENKALPDPNMFILSLQDAGINVRKVSLKPNPVRKILFSGKTFIFFTEKGFKEHREMIQQAGGTVKINPISSSIPDDVFHDDSIVVKITTNDTTVQELIEFDTLLQNKLKQKNLRTINETEIPLAVINASLDQYCNPKYDFTRLFKRKSHVEDTSEVLALDTQDFVSGPMSIIKEYRVSKPVITETNDIQSNSSQSSDHQDSEEIRTSKQDEHFQTSKKNSGESSSGDNKIPVQMKESIVKKAKEPIQASSSTLLKPLNSNNSREEQEASSSMSPNNEDDFCEKKKNKSNKRQRDKSEFDEINENIEQFWPNKRRGSIEVSKTKSASEDIKNIDFIKKESQSQVYEANDKNKNKADKWGFKKTKKRVIDFDLDDMDVDEFKNSPKKMKNDSPDNTTKEFTKNFDLDDSNDNGSKYFDKKVKIDIVDSSTSGFFKTGTSTRNQKAETILEPEKDTDMKQSIQLKIKPIDVPKKKSYFKSTNNRMNEDEIDQEKNIMCKSSSVMSIKSEPDADNLKCGKVFKKINNLIPSVRVPLADMTIWRPN